ncbi:hypothetical protein D477_015361 [Arthrobacter crystallopoietes BAB-32]|uniref:WGR domain-containing protein n=1 Tax=Arthrobacter crystallopoietes BAB-32 TaxID=1246476 RepID=N1V544_9MICC|nr:hypothetical protein [Arthrobacter crystallopoietes]EMY33358.1 hypothetical protein D477_015361 [Arthrobacter crystallopoietes BAB-32]
MNFLRLYKRLDDGTLVFREAWFDEDYAQFVVNHGTVGHQSTTQDTRDVTAETAGALLDAFAVQCAEDGYSDIPPAEQSTVVAQYALKTAAGSERDRYLEDKAKRAITEYFAWRGLGTVERSEFAPHKLNIFCLAPDAAKAVAGLKVCLREAKLDYTKLTIAVAPPEDPEALKQKHPLPAKTPFSLG